MISAIAIDDEPLALAVIQAFCQQIADLDLKRTFTRTGEALAFLQQEAPELVFLDINMPSITGIELSKMLPQGTMVIFTTAYSEYAVEGFNVNATDYLLKPIDFDRFQKAIEKARLWLDFKKNDIRDEEGFIQVKVDYSTVRIPVSEIIYIEGRDNYIKLHLENGKPLLIRMSMKAIEEKLPPRKFIRVHRSFIVALRHVSGVRNKAIHLQDKAFPIGTNYLKDITEMFRV
jgi:DNA-binding LytR/AlgR family response regulator